MAHRSQRSSLEDNPLDPNYLPPHYREEYRLAIDALVEHGLEGYYEFLQNAGVVEFLSQTEVKHILSTVQAPRQSCQPELLYQEPEADGSSDTYWPVHSDLEAPVLDLGWPIHHSFIGPTEVTTLVNPSDPEMPSIKEQARRLIKRAQQVIAVAMDMFTDFDIFFELLNAAARNVAVYILLDEQNAHHFTAMVSSCRINLAMVKAMRVRTVSGITYFCRTGKSFKGQMMDRFLLVDCRAVLSGNYSFMWAFEKIHRSIAHLFLGELVTTFDEEFRILYAQSEPLVMEDALVPMPGDGSYSNKQFSSNKLSVSRNPRYLYTETPHFLDLPGYSTEGHMEVQRNMPAFRRDESGSSYLDPLQKYSNRYSSQQLNMERSFLDPDRPVISRQMDMDPYKRHSYAEGTSASSRQFMQRHIQHYPEEVESFSRNPREEQGYYQGGGTGSGHAIYDHVRAHGYQQMDQVPDQYELGLQPESEPPGSYSHMVDYLSSDSSKEMRYSYGQKLAPGEGWCGRSSMKRPSLGQPYACQTSPTHPPDQNHLFTKSDLDHQPRDPGSKQGLRKWRINSYLNTLENSGEEGVAEPLGPDAFDEPSRPFTEEHYGLETTGPRFGNRDNAQISSSKPDFLPHYGKPVLPKASKDLPEEQPSAGKESQVTTDTTEAAPASGLVSNTEGDKVGEVVFRRPRDIMKQESFRTRPNIPLLRSSRLRSSLIFNSSQVEQHFSMEANPESEVSSAENPIIEKDTLKKFSVLAEILEKRKFLPREPIDWSSLKQPKPEFSLKDVDVSEASCESSSKMLGLSDSCGIALNTEMPKDDTQKEQLQVASEEQTKMTVKRELAKRLPTTQFNMDDPESRLLYFKELAALRKASKMPPGSGVEKKETSVKSEDLPKADSESCNETHVVSDSSSLSANPEQAKDLTNDQTAKQLQVSHGEQIKLAVPKELPKPSPSLPSLINMNDPESRFLYFKQLAANQKALKMATGSAMKTPECGVKNEDLTEASSESSIKKLSMSDSIISGNVEMPKAPTHEQLKIKSAETLEPAHLSHTTPEGFFAVESMDLSEAPSESSRRAPEASPKKDPLHEQQIEEQSSTAPEEQAVVTVPVEPLASSSTTRPSVNMNDPESRFLYFKELAAKQKALKVGMEFIAISTEPSVQNTNATEGPEVTVTDEEQYFVAQSPQKITEKPDEHSSATQPETLQSPLEVSQPEEGHSVTLPESSSEVGTEKPKEHPSVTQLQTPPKGSPKSPDESSSITQQDTTQTPLKTSTEKCEAHPVVPQPEISLGTVKVGTQKPVVSADLISENSVVSLVLSESEVTQETSQLVTKKQEPRSSDELVDSMAEKPKWESAPTCAPCSAQEDAVRSPLPASAHAHMLPGDKQLLTDATDAEKSEWKKSQSQKTSDVALVESGETLPLGPSTSTDPMSIRNEIENPVVLEGTEGVGNAVNVDSPAAPEESASEQLSHEEGETSSTGTASTAKAAGSKEQEAEHSQLSSAAPKTSPPRYQASTTNVLYSSNLRDDTKVILEQISANSQNRMELAKQQTAAITDDAKEVDREQGTEKVLKNRAPGRGFSRFQRPTTSTQEKETLLKKMESMRKEKKVYSRFELGS